MLDDPAQGSTAQHTFSCSSLPSDLKFLLLPLLAPLLSLFPLLSSSSSPSSFVFINAQTIKIMMEGHNLFLHHCIPSILHNVSHNTWLFLGT